MVWFIELTPISTINVKFHTFSQMQKTVYLISDDDTQRIRPFGQPLCLISDEYLEYVNGSDKKSKTSKKK